MFTQFITDRLLKSTQEPEILVFDEYIKLKLNRSKLKFVKEDTPFLDVSCHSACAKNENVILIIKLIATHRMIHSESHKLFGLLLHQMMLSLVKENGNGSPKVFNCGEKRFFFFFFFFLL
jgi:hypothetical protein